MQKDLKIYVSVTSIYQNQKELLATLKSIINQIMLPHKIYVFLSEEPYLVDTGFPNKIITNNELSTYLNKNGDLIKVHWVKNTGPYRKLLPLLESVWEDNCLIITIDDDVEYSREFVKNLVNDYNEHKCVITYRGYTMRFDSFKTIVYNHRDNSHQKYLYNYFTGKGGVLYHPSFFHNTDKLIFNEDIYKECCKTGDDIWFNFVRICNNIECYNGSRPYIIKDNHTPFALYSNYNSLRNADNLDTNTLNMRKTAQKLIELGYLKEIY